jgi:hypothetical protein
LLSFSRNDGAGNDSDGSGSGADSGFSGPVRLRVDNGAAKFDIQDSGVDQIALRSPSGLAVNDGVWHHVAVSRGRSTASLFVDGVLVDNVTSAALANTGPWYAALNQFSLGAVVTSTGPADLFDGLADDVRVYSEALSGPAVLQLFGEWVM